MTEQGFAAAPDGTRLAYARSPGRGPTVVFLGGFRSDMTGTKALHLEAWAQARGQAFLRLDYSGHGASGGRFEDGTIGRWASDARAVIEAAAPGPLLLVGSSMGGWIMVELAASLGARVRGLVGIAAAPDFTEDLIWNRWPDSRRETLMRAGVVTEPSQYDPAGYPITRALIEDGRARLRLRSPIPFQGPVRLLHGMADDAVPWQTSLRLAEALMTDDVRVTLVKAGDHRLSSPSDLALLAATLEEVMQPLAE
jgi:pimeloyl-ACP methyl ester carboxylesterase